MQRAFWPAADGEAPAASLGAPGASMRRALVGLLLAAVALGQPAGAAESPAERVSFMVFGDIAEKAAYEQLVADFTRHHPRSVSLIHIPSQGDYRKRLGVDFAAGNPADIVLLNYRRYGAFAAKGVLEPLGPYLDAQPVFASGTSTRRRWSPSAGGRADVHSPEPVEPGRLLQPGAVRPRRRPRPTDDWTWDDFLHAAREGADPRYKVRGTDRPVRARHRGLDLPPGAVRLAERWRARGRPEGAHAAGAGRAAHARGAAVVRGPPGDASRGARRGGGEKQKAASGASSTAGSACSSTSRSRGADYRTITSFDWDVRPLPRRRQRAGILHADAYCMPKGGRAKAAAWAFIEYANSPEGQRSIATTGRTVPSLRALAESPAFLDPGSSRRAAGSSSPRCRSFARYR